MTPSNSSLNLTTLTPIEKDELQKLKNIWQTLYDHNDSTEFRHPVNWEAYGLLDYPTLIKKPMDLGTVNSKLNDGQYLYVEDMIDDIQLIWDNCKTYNLAGSWIYNLAEKLQKNFKKNLKNYLPNIPFSMGATKFFPSELAPPKSKGGNKKGKEKEKVQQQNLQIFNEENDEERVSYNEKISFSDKLKNLSESNLGLVVDKILQSCPSAFSQIDEGRVQILLQNIDVITFRELQSFVNDLQAEQQYGGIKKIKVN